MTHQEILTKAIRKAVTGGFDVKIEGGWVVYGGMHTRLDGAAPKDIIFNHDFAEALWGKEPFAKVRIPHPDYSDRIALQVLEHWQYHLQQMVIADDPIKYLEANI